MNYNTEKILEQTHLLKRKHSWLSNEEVLSLLKYCLDNCVIDKKNTSHQNIEDYVWHFFTYLGFAYKEEVEAVLKSEKEYRASRSALAKIMNGEFGEGKKK